MTTDPLVFLKETFPALFNKGFAQLEAKAAEGSEGAKAALADVQGVTSVTLLEVEGSGKVYLKADGGKMTVLESAPSAEEIKLAVAAPGDALTMLLGEAQASGELDDDTKAAKRAVRTASKMVQDALSNDSLLFHIVVNDVPELDTVTIKVGLNASEPPAEPGFTATMSFTDLEAAQAGETNVQQLFMGGKLKMEGDYSRALQLGMQLMQMAQQARS